MDWKVKVFRKTPNVITTRATSAPLELSRESSGDVGSFPRSSLSSNQHYKISPWNNGTPPYCRSSNENIRGGIVTRRRYRLLAIYSRDRVRCILDERTSPKVRLRFSVLPRKNHDTCGIPANRGNPTVRRMLAWKVQTCGVNREASMRKKKRKEYFRPAEVTYTGLAGESTG